MSDAINEQKKPFSEFISKLDLNRESKILKEG